MTIPAVLLAGAGYLGGKAIDFASGQANAYAQYAYNKNLMGYQNELNKDYSSWNYTNASSLQRYGLERAGYNPILAVNSGSTFSGGSVGLGSTNMADSHSDFNANQVAKRQTSVQEKAQYSQAELNLTQENVNNSQQLLNNAKLNTEIVTQQNIESQTALNNINTQLGQKDLSWKDRLNLNQVKTNLINAQANRANSIAAQTNAGASVTNAKSNAEFNKRRASGKSYSWSGKGASFGGSYSKSW